MKHSLKILTLFSICIQINIWGSDNSDDGPFDRTNIEYISPHISNLSPSSDNNENRSTLYYLCTNSIYRNALLMPCLGSLLIVGGLYEAFKVYKAHQKESRNNKWFVIHILGASFGIGTGVYIVCKHYDHAAIVGFCKILQEN